MVILQPHRPVLGAKVILAERAKAVSRFVAAIAME
jgi:hypothetical protein